MSQRILIGALILIALGLGIIAYHQSDAIHATENQLRSVEAKLAQAAKATHARVPVVAPVEPAPPTPPAEAGKPTAPVDTAETQRLMDLRTRSALDVQYGALFKYLALPPDKLEKLQRLLQDRRNIFNDVMVVMRNQGIAAIPENSSKIQALVDQSVADIETQLQAALGPEDYARYKGYETTQVYRRTASRVQQRLSYSPEPLTDQQFNQLTDAIVQNNLPVARDLTNPLLGGEAPRITLAVIDQARGFLSPAQLAALQQIYTEQEASSQLARQEAGK